ncbi:MULTISPECIES: DUF167 domain-containing protein [unclassified Sphingomonas]|uniref:DUF167 domain-containing protein n=1 Tax=unclassified Sphingomonas TaxID=196159 RepID=UPI0006FB0FE8|nr:MULTISPECIES: DUF167 domain-containing protein [unclassified Sphingomonas]KQX25697.1 hypothetical protein ASD17_21735 [Sphingomonas sp. Root1294]KQY66686.1 hypothetical protein ASD39_11540 [Sphingomonas sp. Root50]KRB90436.1 hypothetical protein ASE22_15410 [Sphingomonas sp. Root720]
MTLAVRASPRAGRDAIAGVVMADDGRHWLSVKLAAAPSDGAANDALVRLLAKTLGVSRRDVTLASGATSRLKRLHISGDPAALAAALARTIGQVE